MGIKVFAHALHSYEDRATHTVYMIPAGRWRELPDEVGQLLLSVHSKKLCDVSNEENPDNHTCALTEEAPVYDRRDIQEPPMDTMARVRMSPQKKAKVKAAKKRSLRARRGLN